MPSVAYPHHNFTEMKEHPYSIHATCHTSNKYTMNRLRGGITHNWAIPHSIASRPTGFGLWNSTSIFHVPSQGRRKEAMSWMELLTRGGFCVRNKALINILTTRNQWWLSPRPPYDDELGISGESGFLVTFFMFFYENIKLHFFVLGRIKNSLRKGVLQGSIDFMTMCRCLSFCAFRNDFLKSLFAASSTCWPISINY